MTKAPSRGRGWRALMSDAGTRPTVPLDELARCSRTALPVDPWGKQVARPSALRQQNWDIGCRYWVGMMNSSTAGPVTRLSPLGAWRRTASPLVTEAGAFLDGFTTTKFKAAVEVCARAPGVKAPVSAAATRMATAGECAQACFWSRLTVPSPTVPKSFPEPARKTKGLARPNVLTLVIVGAAGRNRTHDPLVRSSFGSRKLLISLMF